MRLRVIITVLAATLDCVPALAFPGGSYAASCHAIHMEGPYLIALCGRVDGSLRWSRIFAPRCGDTGVSNQNGHLVCGGYFR